MYVLMMILLKMSLNTYVIKKFINFEIGISSIAMFMSSQ